MRAIKIKKTGDWIRILHDGEIFTGDSPDIFNNSATLEGLKDYYNEEFHKTLHIDELEMFEIEINIVKKV